MQRASFTSEYIVDLCTLKIDVTYQDTDVAGVVYFANYFNYAEKGRSKIIKGLLGETKFSTGGNWIVRSTSAKYLKPAKIDEEIVVITSISNLKSASVIFFHDFYVENILIVTMEAHLLYVDESLKPTRIDFAVLNNLSIIYNSTKFLKGSK